MIWSSNRAQSSINFRADRHSVHPDHSGCEMDESCKVRGPSVVAGSKAAEALELVEAAFDAVALFVGIGVVRNDDPAGAV